MHKKSQWQRKNGPYKRGHFKNTKLLAGNDHVIDIFTSKNMENILPRIFYLTVYYTGCIKKTEQIWNRSKRREAAQSMKFLINTDCLGIYDVE